MTIQELMNFVPKIDHNNGYMGLYEISLLEDYYMFTIDEFIAIPNNLKSLIELDLISSSNPDVITCNILLEHIRLGKDTTMDFVTYLKICNPCLFYLVPNKVYCDINTLVMYICYVDKEFKAEYLGKLKNIKATNILSKLLLKQLTV